MDQSHYLIKVLDKLHMSAEKHQPTELPMNGYDSLRQARPNDTRINQKDYQHTIGSISYAAIHTRLDIAFAVGRLSQYLNDHTKHQGHAIKSSVYSVYDRQRHNVVTRKVGVRNHWILRF